jgi:hypothetical protein
METANGIYHTMESTISLSDDIIVLWYHQLAAPAELGTAGWLWNFRLDDVGRWHDLELHYLGGPPGLNEPGVQLEESTNRFQYKKTDSEVAGPT